MSETQTADDGARAVPPDPIYQKSYSVHIAVASVALVGAVALAITDEIWLRRPYKAYQADYKAAKLAFLDKVEKERKDFDGALRSLDEFKALAGEYTVVPVWAGNFSPKSQGQAEPG